MQTLPARSRCILAGLVLVAAGCSGRDSRTQEPSAVAPPPATSSSGQSAPPPATMPDAGASAPADAAVADAAVAIELPPMPTGLHGPPRPWRQMNDRQRGQYMGQAVMPVMEALFRAYDATHFAEPSCATCHGANARQVHFRMPNTLPVLPAWGTEAAERAHAQNPRMYAFMGQRVVPAMAQLLGEEPYNPQTQRGFGCNDCHPHEAH